MKRVVLAFDAEARKSATPPSSTPGSSEEGATPIASILMVQATKRTLPDFIADCNARGEGWIGVQ